MVLYITEQLSSREQMTNKRECPPTFSPPPSLTMPWMRAPTTPSFLNQMTSSPIRSQLLQNSIAAAQVPVNILTQGEAARLELANTARLVSPVTFW